MEIALHRKSAKSRAVRRFGSEADVEAITGISRRTLQKHRLLGRGFNFYRYGRRVLYDLDEVEQQIRTSGNAAPEERIERRLPAKRRQPERRSAQQ